MSQELLLDTLEKALPPVIEDFLPRDLPEACFVSEYTRRQANDNEYFHAAPELLARVVQQELDVGFVVKPSMRGDCRRVCERRRQVLRAYFHNNDVVDVKRLARRHSVAVCRIAQDLQKIGAQLRWRWEAWARNSFEDPFAPINTSR